MKNTLKLIIAVAVPLAVGGLSGFATAGGVSTWYPTLVKPAFNPPAWVFGPVWTVLYVMMGVANVTAITVQSISGFYSSADFREGLEAFLAKRKPDWQGR